MNRHWFKCIFALASLLICSGTAWASKAVEATLSLPEARIEAGSAVSLQFTITNKTDQPRRVLKWNTPLEGVLANIFHVVRNGEEALYKGITVRRADPVEDDYVTLAPGKTVDTTIDLAEYYDLTYDGAYEIKLETAILDTGPEKGVRSLANMSAPEKLTSNLVTLQVSGGKTGAMPKIAPDPKLQTFQELSKTAAARAPTFTNCSSTQQSNTTPAFTESQRISRGASNYLAACGSSDPAGDYATWFGAQTAARLTTVSNNFNAIANALENETIEFICGSSTCGAGWYAFVYPTQPYKVYLCSGFWSAPTSGFNSKADTIVHEVSHFNVVAGTDDHTYGQTNCKNLASSDPSRAIENADNYAYFAADEPVCVSGLEHFLLGIILVTFLILWMRRRRLSVG